MMTYRSLYEEGKAILAGMSPVNPDAALDARILLEAVCGTSLTTLMADGDSYAVTDEQVANYRAYIRRRAAHEPVAYILGNQDFMGLSFDISPDVLIPEQDTENLVEEAMKDLHDGDRVLDLCTGSGCILLSLLHYSNETAGVGTDLSAAALAVARKNADKLGLAERCSFLEGDLFGALETTGVDTAGAVNRTGAGVGSDFAADKTGGDGTVERGKASLRFDMIISNPPYIPTDVIPTLMPEVSRSEPHMALDGGADGLVFYRRIAEEAPRYLVKGGVLLLETGFDEAGAVRDLLAAQGFTDLRVVKDYGSLDRVVRGVWQ